MERVLTPLVDLLQAHPPPEVAAALRDEAWAVEALVAPAEERATSGVGAGAGPPTLSPLERSAAGALAQLALSAGGDAAWKPLQHKVLMRTRAREGATRLAALGALRALVSALGEEYLALLPEALPFLAELLEDGEPAVEAAAQSLFAELEKLSGEDLGQYLKA